MAAKLNSEQNKSLLKQMLFVPHTFANSIKPILDHYHPKINGFTADPPTHRAAVWITDNPTQEIDLGVSR